HPSTTTSRYVLPLPASFSFTTPPTTAPYTLSLHDALPISQSRWSRACRGPDGGARRDHGGEPRNRGHHLRAETAWPARRVARREDRKSTRLNSSHLGISYAVFCLKKKNKL